MASGAQAAPFCARLEGGRPATYGWQRPRSALRAHAGQHFDRSRVNEPIPPNPALRNTRQEGSSPRRKRIATA